MKQVINDRVTIVFSHSKTRDEDVAARELAASLSKDGVSTGQKMQVKDGLGDPSIMENLLWFVTHPETVSAAKDIFVGSALIFVGYWLKGDGNRSLRVEYDNYKVEAKNIDELKEAIRLLPPPSVKEILEDGDKIINGEVVSKDDDDT